MSAVSRCLRGMGMATALLVAGCKPSGHESLLRGDAALQAGQPDAAIPWLERAAQLLPSEAEAWNRLGVAYHQAGRLDDAAKAYGRALHFNRDLFDVHFNLGELLLEQGRHREADASFRTYLNAAQDNARNPAAWRGLGLALQGQRQHPTAEIALGNAVRLNPSDALAWNALGVSRVQMRKHRDAQAALLKATQTDPQLPAARLNLAVVLHQYLASPRDALAQYQAFLQLQPEGPEADSARIAVRDLSTRLGLAPSTTPAAPGVAQNPASTPRRPPITTASSTPPTNNVPVGAAPTVTVPPSPTLPPPATAAQGRPGALATPPSPAPNPGPRPVAQTPPSPSPAPATQPPRPAAPVTITISEASASTPAPTPAPRIPIPEPTPVTPPEEGVPDVGSRAVAPVAAPKPPPPTLEIVRVREEPPPRPAVDPPSPPATVLAALPAAPAAAEEAKAPVAKDLPIEDAGNDADAAQGEGNKVVGKEPRSVWRRMNPSTWGNPVRWFRKGSDPAHAPAIKSPPPSAPGSTGKPKPTVAPKPRMPAPLVTPLDADPGPRPAFPRYQRTIQVAPRPGNTGAAQAEFLRGAEAHGRGDAAAAIAAYRKAIAIDPAHFASHYNLSLLALQQGNLPDALRSAELALAIDPASLVARYNFAVALQRSRHVMDAADELERITRDQPAEANAHLALASLCDLDLHDVARAREHYQRVIATQPNHPKADFIQAWLERHPRP